MHRTSMEGKKIMLGYSDPKRTWPCMYTYSVHRRMSASQMCTPDKEAKARERLWTSFPVFVFTLAIAQGCFSSPWCQNHHRAANFSSSHEFSLSTGWFADPTYNSLNQTYGLSWHRIMLLMSCM